MVISKANNKISNTQECFLTSGCYEPKFGRKVWWENSEKTVVFS